VTEATRTMYEAGFALLYADDEGRVAYANRAAQLALGAGATWEGTVGRPLGEVLPSLGAVELGEGASRVGVDLEAGETRLLAATAWDVQSPGGGSLGVAAAWGEWERDGAVLSAAQPEPPAAAEAPAADELEAARAAVAAQGDEVRRLKEGQGLSNGDPAVAAAVAELLERKAALAALEERADAAGGGGGAGDGA